MSQLLTKAEVAELLKLSTRSVDRLRKTGELPEVIVLKSIRFREEDVIALMNGRPKPEQA